MSHAVRLLAHWALLAHIYVSMAGFTLAFLFGATGLALNHQDFALSEPKVTRKEIALGRQFVDNANRSALEERVRREFGIREPTVDYHEDPDGIEFTFAAPGVRNVVNINRADGSAESEKESRGVLGKLGDLHKGSDTGNVWHWTIDVAALFLVISSLTGIVTMLALRARRRTGFMLLGFGVLTVVAIYFVWVPK
jgi:hypothetical protein